METKQQNYIRQEVERTLGELWNFCPQAFSLPEAKVPYMELSLLAAKMSWNFRSHCHWSRLFRPFHCTKFAVAPLPMVYTVSTSELSALTTSLPKFLIFNILVNCFLCVTMS